jgi:hypothetical protein
MSTQDYEEMMSELNNDPRYVAFCGQRQQETWEAIDRLTDAEIEEIFGIIE